MCLGCKEPPELYVQRVKQESREDTGRKPRRPRHVKRAAGKRKEFYREKNRADEARAAELADAPLAAYSNAARRAVRRGR